jgi:putative transposase
MYKKKNKNTKQPFKWKHFPGEIILWLVRWYCRYALSYGDLKEVAQGIYTTNAIESINMTLRKVMRNKRIFPSNEAAFKLIYLALQNISKNGHCRSEIGNLHWLGL